MPGLRERQKEARVRRILDIARDRFKAEGFEQVTIESIASAADVSAVTIYNYYRSKAGLLLALVEESDEILVEKLRALVDAPPPDIREGVARFAQINRRHALTYLTKPTWRQVLAASFIEGSDNFGRTFSALDAVLTGLMSDLVRTYQSNRALSCDLDAAVFGDTLFALQNYRFGQFIADDRISDEQVDARLRADLDQIFHDQMV